MSGPVKVVQGGGRECLKTTGGGLLVQFEKGSVVKIDCTSKDLLELAFHLHRREEDGRELEDRVD